MDAVANSHGTVVCVWAFNKLDTLLVSVVSYLHHIALSDVHLRWKLSTLQRVQRHTATLIEPILPTDMRSIWMRPFIRLFAFPFKVIIDTEQRGKQQRLSEESNFISPLGASWSKSRNKSHFETFNIGHPLKHPAYTTWNLWGHSHNKYEWQLWSC